MKIYTIGFTKIAASGFFNLLRKSGAKRLVDVRLNNVSQLAGFAKKNDLEYFLNNICDMDYVHLPALAPTKEMLDGYRNQHHDWDRYQREFLALMQDRRIEKTIPKRTIANACLLCSRGQARPVPPPPRRRISQPALGQPRNRTSRPIADSLIPTKRAAPTMSGPLYFSSILLSV